MTDDTDRILDLLGGKSAVSMRVGRFVGIGDGMALIDVDKNRFPVAFLDGQIPMINDPVNIMSIDGQWFLAGPSRAKPRVGTVITVSLPSVSILTSVGTILAIVGGTAPSSGDRVLIDWTEDGPVSGVKLATTPSAPLPPPNPGTGTPTVKEATFRAIDAGSTDRNRIRWWTGEPWASDNTFGAWFYGSQIKDTIPAGSTLVSMEMYINRTRDDGAAPRFTLHTSGWKQGIPAMSGALTWDPPAGWNYVPNAGWFAELIAGGGYWGIGLNQGGWNQFASLAADGMSGALRIKWK